MKLVLSDTGSLWGIDCFLCAFKRNNTCSMEHVPHRHHPQQAPQVLSTIALIRWRSPVLRSTRAEFTRPALSCPRSDRHTLTCTRFISSCFKAKTKLTISRELESSVFERRGLDHLLEDELAWLESWGDCSRGLSPDGGFPADSGEAPN